MPQVARNIQHLVSTLEDEPTKKLAASGSAGPALAAPASATDSSRGEGLPNVLERSRASKPRGLSPRSAALRVEETGGGSVVCSHPGGV